MLVSDVATVTVGNQPRLGIAGQDDDDDIVQGIVLMRRGAESLPTIRRVEALMQQINHAGILPPGVHIERIYDRSDLINVTTHTVLHNMLVGMVLIFIVQWMFLGNLRSALIVAATIPFALAFAIGLLLLRGELANLLSVGAIDFGLIVDATVIMVENIIRRLSQPPVGAIHAIADGAPLASDRRTARQIRGDRQRRDRGEPGIFFSAAIIIAGFVPLFTMSGIEGHIFGPMAKTYAYAIAGGLIATFTVTPALCAMLLRDQEKENRNPAGPLLHRIYEPIAALRPRQPRPHARRSGCCCWSSPASRCGRSGLEFLPKLEEGNLWIRATMPTSISLEESNAYVNRMRNIMQCYPRWSPSSRSTAGRTTAPTPPASSTPNSSCR